MLGLAEQKKLADDKANSMGAKSGAHGREGAYT
ncbi:hypothetical protein J2S34_002924 [Nitrobacter winogradskyi]|uniref:Uncharacterized protein n=1 Tax=Nitrobacter winogradskyi TaxID=913 RepID=A0ACC6ALE3_NITWI|nr:hypothetical protein [Nitrobacter winogradskyi]